MITDAIKKSFESAKKKGWEYTYWAVDIHDTAIVPNYKAGDIPTTFYPLAKGVLQDLTVRKDVKLILYTCSHPWEIEKYIEFFEQNGIHFDFINENPEVTTDVGGYGNYDKKMYFNVLLEDKASFDPLVDWKLIKDFLEEYDKQQNNVLLDDI